MAFVHAHAASASAASVTVLDMSASIANGDILVAFGLSWKSGASQGAIAFPAGFTIWYAQTTANFKSAIAWKRAASESGDYIITSSTASEMQAGICAYSGRLASGDPLDVGSSTAYVVDNTTVRGADVTIATAGSDLVWAGWNYHSTLSLTSPGGMASRVSNDDLEAIEMADLVNQAAGATGNKDGTAGANTPNKHAFLVALKPAVTSVGAWLHQMRRPTTVPAPIPQAPSTRSFQVLNRAWHYAAVATAKAAFLMQVRRPTTVPAPIPQAPSTRSFVALGRNSRLIPTVGAWLHQMRRPTTVPAPIPQAPSTRSFQVLNRAWHYAAVATAKAAFLMRIRQAASTDRNKTPWSQ